MLQAPPLKRLSHPTSGPDLLRVILFSIHQIQLALPISVVLKVISCPPVTPSAQEGLGLIDLGDQTITVVSLFHRLCPQDQPHTLQRRFVILTQTQMGEICGLLVDTPPNLLEIPLDKVRPLPSTYRQTDPLGMVSSHVAVLPQEDQEPLQIFLLGMGQSVQRALNQSHRLQSGSPA